MTSLSVWAPYAADVALDWSVNGSPVVRDPMIRLDGGWWSWPGDPASYDVFDYSFVLDGTPLPDPRSAWQPQGVDGPSRFFDASAIRWTDGSWRGPQDGAGSRGAVIYEMHVGTFTAEGTFDAAITRLDYLAELGVDVVEVLPIAAFPGKWGWGYDGVGLYAVHDQYGGPAAFARFVDAAHARGLGVCLDVVHNHLGPSGNYLGKFGPYFTDTHTTPWGPAVNLDAEGSAEVRRFLIQQALRWFRDFHVDALRLDAVHALRDDSPRHFLAELADEVAALAVSLGRPLELIAESDLNDARMVTATANGGFGMSAQWADDIHHALHVELTGETQGYYADFADPDALRAVLEGVFFHAGTWSSFRERVWGAPVDRASVSGDRFVAYLQTHDQVGNRATGDRISASISPGQQAIGAALYILSPFTPMIFMGEEWAASTPWQFFSSFDDPVLADAVRTGRRAEFASHGWSADDVPDPQDPATRKRSVLDWDERLNGEHAAMLDWYRTLLRLRHNESQLRDPSLLSSAVSYDRESGVLEVRHGDFRIVANLGVEQRLVEVGGGVVVAEFGDVRPGLSLGAHSIAIVRL